jgi:hypothetical protein
MDSLSQTLILQVFLFEILEFTVGGQWSDVDKNPVYERIQSMKPLC